MKTAIFSINVHNNFEIIPKRGKQLIVLIPAFTKYPPDDRHNTMLPN